MVPSIRHFLTKAAREFDKFVGFDLDGTLARSPDEFDIKKVGEPIKPMVDKLREHLAKGDTVKIFTARASTPGAAGPIHAWLKKHDLPELEVTNVKTPGLKLLYDDRAVGVVRDKGTVKSAARMETRTRTEEKHSKHCPHCGFEFGEKQYPVRKNFEGNFADIWMTGEYDDACPDCDQIIDQHEPTDEEIDSMHSGSGLFKGDEGLKKRLADEARKRRDAQKRRREARETEKTASRDNYMEHCLRVNAARDAWVAGLPEDDSRLPLVKKGHGRYLGECGHVLESCRCRHGMAAITLPIPCEDCVEQTKEASTVVKALSEAGIPRDVQFFTGPGGRATACFGDWHSKEVMEAGNKIGRKLWPKYEEPDDTEIGKPDWATGSVSSKATASQVLDKIPHKCCRNTCSRCGKVSQYCEDLVNRIQDAPDHKPEKETTELCGNCRVSDQETESRRESDSIAALYLTAGAEKQAVVKQDGDAWKLYTADGSRVLGTHASARAAYAQEHAIVMQRKRKAVLTLLQRAKVLSDAGDYSGKNTALRGALTEGPGEFVRDSKLNRFAGITHKPSGFRIHAPNELAAGVPMHKAAQARWRMLENLAKLGIRGVRPEGGVAAVRQLAGMPGQLKVASVAAALRRARNVTHTHPTKAQADAGNYRKGEFQWQGLRIKIENPEGSTRRGVSKSGKPWQTTMKADYGYFAGSRSAAPKGPDNDPIDVFVGPDLDSDVVAVVDQTIDGDFDESKVLIGIADEHDAKALYLSNYSKGWEVGPITMTTVAGLKSWLRDGDTKKPFARYKAAAENTGDKPLHWLLGSEAALGLGSLAYRPAAAAVLGGETPKRNAIFNKLLDKLLAQGGRLDIDGKYKAQANTLDKEITLGTKMMRPGALAHEMGHLAQNPKALIAGKALAGGQILGLLGATMSDDENKSLGFSAAGSAAHGLGMLAPEVDASAKGYRMLRQMGSGRGGAMKAFVGVPTYAAATAVPMIVHFLRKSMGSFDGKERPTTAT